MKKGKPKNQKIPESVKEEAKQTIEKYNKDNNEEYQISFRGSFAYLKRIEKLGPTKIGRLKYLPAQKKWDFAVFKYSSERYDPNEFIYPGRELLDGTIEGALKAGMLIYPPSEGIKIRFNFWGCLLLLFIIPIRLIGLLFRKLIGRS